MMRAPWRAAMAAAAGSTVTTTIPASSRTLLMAAITSSNMASASSCRRSAGSRAARRCLACTVSLTGTTAQIFRETLMRSRSYHRVGERVGGCEYVTRQLLALVERYHQRMRHRDWNAKRGGFAGVGMIDHISVEQIAVARGHRRGTHGESELCHHLGGR